MRISKAAVAASLLWVSACGSGAQDGRNPMGSQALVTSQDFQALYVASADEGVVAKVDAAAMTAQQLDVGGEPTRLARVGDRLLVSLRTQRSIQEIVDNGTSLTPGRTVEVGAEPVGLVATEDGTKVYVAVSMTSEVKELDAVTLEVLRVWSVPGEPRWLALHPSGQALYVAGPTQDGLHWVDLQTGAVAPVSLPSAEGFSAPEFLPVVLAGRATGDPAASPNGSYIAVPMLFVDNTTPLTEPDPDAPGEPIEESGYGGRMNPTVALVPVDGSGAPEKTLPTLLQASSFEVSGYLASVNFTPDSEFIVATVEGAAAILVIRTEIPSGLFDIGNSSVDVAPPGRGVGFDFRDTQVIQAGIGPRGAAFTSKSLGYVYSFMDRTVTQLNMDQIRAGFDGNGERLFSPTGVAATLATVEVTPEVLPPDVAEGRRLFYATNDPRVSRTGAAVSCATCHFDGRADTLTWAFDRGPRQTPSLAGVVSSRAPVRWEGDKATVADDALDTSQGLMGGEGLWATDAERIAQFIDYTRAVDLPLKGSTDPQVERGREIFSREDVGCAGCHSGALFTDKQRYTMFGFVDVKTPSLVGVGATAPYLHDGSAPTLRAVLDAARSGVMGDTSSLSEAEMQDLETFLKSL